MQADQAAHAGYRVSTGLRRRGEARQLDAEHEATHGAVLHAAHTLTLLLATHEPACHSPTHATCQSAAASAQYQQLTVTCRWQQQQQHPSATLAPSSSPQQQHACSPYAARKHATCRRAEELSCCYVLLCCVPQLLPRAAAGAIGGRSPCLQQRASSICSCLSARTQISALMMRER